MFLYEMVLIMNTLSLSLSFLPSPCPISIYISRLFDSLIVPWFYPIQFPPCGCSYLFFYVYMRIVWSRVETVERRFRRRLLQGRGEKRKLSDSPKNGEHFSRPFFFGFCLYSSFQLSCLQFLGWTIIHSLNVWICICNCRILSDASMFFLFLIRTQRLEKNEKCINKNHPNSVYLLCKDGSKF